MSKLHIPRWLKIIAAAYAAYLALILIVATPLVNIFAPKIYREQTGAELKLDHIIWLNPFTLTATAKNAGSANADGSAFWSFDELEADISLASLWRSHLVLDSLTLNVADIQIHQTAVDRFNFSDIIDYRARKFPAQPAEHRDENAQNADPSKPLALEISTLNLTAKHLGYRAPHAAEPVNIEVAGLHFSIENISTLPESPTAEAKIRLRGGNLAFAVKTLSVDFIREQTPFAIALRDLNVSAPAFSTARDTDYTASVLDNNGGSIRIAGKTAIAQANASGRAQLQGIDLLPAWQYLIDKLAFDAEHAQLDGDINFRVDWHDAFNYQVRDSQLALRNVKLQSRANAETGAALEALRIEGLAVDSTQPSVRIARVALEKPVLRGWNRDTEVSLIEMFEFSGSDEESPPSPWRVLVDAIDVVDGSVHWRATQLDNRKLTVAPLNLHLTNLHWPDATPLQFKGNAAIGGETGASQNIDIAFDGEIIPGDVTGKINATVSHLPLVLGNSFLQQQIRATIAAGSLNAQLSMTLDKAQVTQVESAGSVDQLELLAAPDKRKLIAWTKLEWRQFALDPIKQRIHIKQMIATQPWAQFRLNNDGTNNFQQLLIDNENGNTNTIDNTNQTDNTNDTNTTNDTNDTNNSGKSSRPAEKKSASTAKKPWQLAVDNIHIDRAAIDFRDASLTSAFRTNITDLSGDISRLDTSARRAKERPAKVALKGTVDGYAPVAITGTFNPFAAQPALNITLDITNLDLATLTPYSGTYAGYKIDSGRLSVQMAYTLENDRIKGTNHIVVNQMKLGEQVSGPKVRDLPLRLAIYLLTDSNGVMDMGVDVTGNVDDPDFSVGSIIWKALRNLIVKTAASPFKALARFGGSDRDDLDRIEFQAGNSELAAGENEKLSTIQKGLEQKPALQLNLMGHVSPSRDLEALRDNSLSAQLIAQGGITASDIQQQTKNWQREVIELFKQRFPEDKTAVQVMQMNDTMRDNIELPPTALQELAADRALVVKQMLVTDHGLSADRVFVKPTDLGADETSGAVVTMAVE